MKIRVSTHKPKPGLWMIALVIFIYGLLGFVAPGLPFVLYAFPVSAVWLLLITTIV